MALTIPINLNIENLAELNAQVAKMAGAAGGAGAGAAGRGPGGIGSLFGGSEGAGGSTAKGLGQIAKQLPGAGVLGDMGSAFKSGGIIGVGMAGVAGILGFVKQIFESSKVFQGIAGSFFKIFGAMADMFLLPFLPLAMRGMQMLMKWMPEVQSWGVKTAAWIETFIGTWSQEGFAKAVKQHIQPAMMEIGNKIAQQLSFGLVKEKDYKYDAATGEVIETEREDDRTAGQRMEDKTRSTGKWMKWGGVGVMAAGVAAAPFTGGASLAAIPLGAKMAAGGYALEKGVNTFAGTGEGRGEQFSPIIKRGDQLSGVAGIEKGVGSIMNSMEVSLVRQSEKIQDYATQFHQKEMGAGGMLGVWDDEVLRGAIPDTWDSIDGMYRTMNDELTDEARNAETLKGGLVVPDIDLGAPIKQTQEEIERALKELSTITLSKFVLDPSVANDIENCFIMANQCLNTKFTSLADLVEGGVEYIQAGVGGNIFNLTAINDLVTQAQGMGGAIATEATRIAQQVALMSQQMADPSLEQTVNATAIAAEIRQLQATVDARMLSTANSIAAATANVNGIVDQWAHMANDWMDPSLGYGEQFGVLGSAFGEATGKASDMYSRIRGFRIKRRTQVGGSAAAAAGGDDTGDSTGDAPIAPPGVGVGGDTEPPPPIFEPDEFEQEWGAPEAEIIAIPDTGTGFAASEENMEIFNDYVDARAEAITSAAMSTDWQESRSMDWLWDPYGEQFGSAGGGGGRRGVRNVSHSVMNISINTRSSVQDILSDLRRVQHMDDASFFNGVS